MKSLSVPLLCLIFVFSFWCLSASYTQNTESQLTPILKETQDAALKGQWERADAAYKHFYILWKKYHLVYSYYMNSSDTEEIERSVRRGSGYLSSRDTGLLCGEMEHLSALLKDRTEENEICAANIF